MKKLRKTNSPQKIAERRLRKKKLAAAARACKDVSTYERQILKSYVKCNGQATLIAKEMGIGVNTVSKVLKRKNVQKAIIKVFAKLDLDIVQVCGVVKQIMFTTGDYHNDQNRLKAVDLYCKMIGAYAPKQVNHTGSVEHLEKHEVKATLVKVLKVMHESEKEEKDNGVIAISAEAV